MYALLVGNPQPKDKIGPPQAVCVIHMLAAKLVAWKGSILTASDAVGLQDFAIPNSVVNIVTQAAPNLGVAINA